MVQNVPEIFERIFSFQARFLAGKFRIPPNPWLAGVKCGFEKEYAYWEIYFRAMTDVLKFPTDISHVYFLGVMF